MIAGENSVFTLIRCESNEDWLEQRTKGVGGSDVASIMGLSPWKTPAQTWLEKTGNAAPDDLSDKPFIVFGVIMEPLIGKWFAEQHPDFKVRRVNAVCQSIARPWAQASLDFEVYDGKSWGVLEIKTARSAKDWDDGVPSFYLTQTCHYMDVTDRKYAYVAVFFRDTCEFREYRIERDEDDIAAVRSAVDSFWHDYVETNVMPVLTGTSGEASDLAWMWDKGSGFEQTFDPEVNELISAYQDAAEREKQAKADKTAASTKLIGIIGNNKGVETDVARVTWVRGERESFDTKALKRDHPDIYAKYAKRTTRNGGLRIKELA